MEKIIDLHLEFYREIKKNNNIIKILGQDGVKILQGFNENVHLVRQFYEKYYSKNNENRIVLCGINPGKDGAGKTGIPFIDFAAASQLLSNIQKEPWEKSSEFIFSVIEEIGVKNFFDNVYLTNVSWIGFKKGKKNHNYYRLPSYLPNFFTAKFIDEMNIVKPKIIIPLSEKVEETLVEMKESGSLVFELAPRLRHPRWCMIDKDGRTQKFKKEYVATILKYMEGNKQKS